MEAALAGDAGALDQLLRRHYPMVHGLCRRLTGNAADADDAAQEALVAIARGVANGRFDGQARFSTWAYRVATNACLDELRRRRRRPVPVDDQPLERRAAADPGPESAGDRVDVDRALAHLTPEFRAAVVLRDLCRLDYAEIAHVLGIPVGTVRSRIARGRAALVPLLGNPSPDGDRPTSETSTTRHDP